MNLKIDHVQHDRADHLSVSGEIDAYTAPELRKTLLPLTEKEECRVIVDLANVDYMDSTGLGIFIAALKSCKKHHGTLQLKNLTNRVERLFKITGLTEIVSIENVKGGAT